MTDHSNNPLPHGVQMDLNDAKQPFLHSEFVEKVDPTYNRVIEGLDQALEQHEQFMGDKGNNYLFNHADFVEALSHILTDQRSALKKEKLSIQEFSIRTSRWFVFCNAVVNMGITCMYSREAVQSKDYPSMFQKLELNKQFEVTFLKPRGIKIEFRHKNAMVKEKYPWLAMPCLIVVDEGGKEHEVALTPSPDAQVWWLDVLAEFHESYNWNHEVMMATDGAPASSLDDPYALLDEDEEEDDEFSINPEFVAEMTKAAQMQADAQKASAPPPPAVTTPSSPVYPPEGRRQGWFAKLFAVIRKFMGR
jgi:hypothetical protein